MKVKLQTTIEHIILLHNHFFIDIINIKGRHCVIVSFYSGRVLHAAVTLPDSGKYISKSPHAVLSVI